MFNDKKNLRLRNEVIHVITFEFSFHLHVEIINLVGSVGFLRPNDQLDARVWRENLSTINLAEGSDVTTPSPQFNL